VNLLMSESPERRQLRELAQQLHDLQVEMATIRRHLERLGIAVDPSARSVTPRRRLGLVASALIGIMVAGVAATLIYYLFTQGRN
jgi:hypothetical protein